MSELARVGNWVGEITATVGTGDIELGGAIDGFTTFQSIGEGFIYYAIVEGNNREAGKGVLYGIGENLFQRTDVYSTLVDGVYNDDNPDPIELNGLASVYCTFNERAFRELTQDALSVYYNNSVSGASSNSVGEALDELFNAPGAREFYKAKIEVTEGQTLLLLDSNFDSVILIVDGLVKQQTSGDYSVDYGNRSIILPAPLIGTEKVEAWVNQVEFVDAIKEAPVDGKPYARQDASWEEIVPVDSEFKMEDATDAELNTDKAYTQYEYVIVAGEPDALGECAGYFGELRCYDTDYNGLLVPLAELAGTSYFSINGSEFTELQLVTFTDQGGGSPNKFHIGGSSFTSWLSAQSAQNDDVIKFSKNSPTGDADIPLKDGDVWSYNESEKKFKPTQIESESADFKMEDATDAELNTSSPLDPNGYSWDRKIATNQQGGCQNDAVGIITNILDLNGAEIIPEDMNGQQFSIYMNEVLSLEDVTVTASQYSETTIRFGWGGYINSSSAVYKLVPYGLAKDALQDGDVWIFNAAEGKFKPTQIESGSTDPINNADILNPNDIGFDLFLIEDNTRVSKDPALNQGKDSSVRGVLANVTGKFQIRSYSRQPDTGTGELGMESQIGICDINFDLDTDASQSKNNWIGFTANNEFYRIRGWVDDTDTQIVQSVPLDKIQKDIPIDLLLDFDNGTFEVRIDGTQVGNVEAIPTGIEWYPYLTPQAGNDLSIDLTGDTFTPESGYKVWNTFIPSPGLTDFKMEDATDADRNLDPVTNLDPDGYRFKVTASQTNAGDITPQQYQGWWSNVLDLDNKTIPLAGLDGVEVDVYYDNAAPFRVTMLTNWVGINAYSWDGIGDIRPLLQTVTDVKFVPVDAARVPLKDGDAWIYNEAESKFKPNPVVPTVVVTEFPETPDANTLYIKVV